MTRNVSTSWKTIAVLTMILFQIISGSLCSTPLADRTGGASGIVAVMQERAAPAENRALILSDADHHVRCEQRCPQAETDDMRRSDVLQYAISKDAVLEGQSYLISRPPKRLI
jgi:hypothetical protein